VVLVYFQERGDLFINPLESHHTRVPQSVIPHLDEPILVASHGDVDVQAGAAVQGGVVALQVLVPEKNGVKKIVTKQLI